MPHNPEAVRRRLRSMGILEAVNIIWGPLLLLAFRCPWTLANVAGIVAMDALLLIGSAYWWVKLDQIDRRLRRPSGLAVFAVLRPVGWVLSLAGLGIPLAAASSSALGAWLPGALIGLMAVLEQINYFHIQLSHDNRHDLARLLRAGLHRSPLARDLASRG